MRLVELVGDDLGRNGLFSSRATLILPLGSVEYHGPHLPLGTDSFLADAYAREVGQRLQVAVAPPVYYGPCWNLHDHPGTLSISLQAYRSFLVCLLQEFIRNAFTHLFLFSGHAEDSQLISIRSAIEEVLAQHNGVRAHLLSTYHISRDLVPTDQEDLHAGQLETSLLLHVAPQWVRNASSVPPSRKSLPPHEVVANKREAWQSGVAGNPQAATPEMGSSAFARTVDRLAAYVVTAAALNTEQ